MSTEHVNGVVQREYNTNYLIRIFVFDNVNLLLFVCVQIEAYILDQFRYINCASNRLSDKTNISFPLIYLQTI